MDDSSWFWDSGNSYDYSGINPGDYNFLTDGYSLPGGSYDPWSSNAWNGTSYDTSSLSGIGSALSSLFGGLTQSGSGVGSSSLLSNLLTGGGGLYSAYAQGQLADKQMALAKYVLENGDPYKEYRTHTEIPMMQGISNRIPGQMDQAQNYSNQADSTLADSTMLNRLKQSYTDPLSVYNSPEMQALNQQFMNGIERRDAAAGRNSQYGARAVEAQNNFLTSALPQYRQGLIGGIGAQVNQGGALSNLFGQQANYANQLGNLAKPGGQAGAGVSQFGNIASGANAANAYSLNPLFGSLASIFGQHGSA